MSFEELWLEISSNYLENSEKSGTYYPDNHFELESFRKAIKHLASIGLVKSYFEGPNRCTYILTERGINKIIE